MLYGALGERGGRKSLRGIGNTGGLARARNPAVHKSRAEHTGHTEGRPGAGPGASAHRRPPRGGRSEGPPPAWCCSSLQPFSRSPNQQSNTALKRLILRLTRAHLQPRSVRLNLPPARHSRNLRAARHKGTQSRQTARPGSGFQTTEAGLCLGRDTKGRIFCASCPQSPNFR